MRALSTIGVNEVISEFDKVIRERSPKNIGEARKIKGQIEHAKTVPLMVYDEKAIKAFLISRSKTLSGLIRELLVAKMTALYGLVDPALLNFKRHIVIENNTIVKDARRKAKNEKGQASFEIPLFVVADIAAKKIQLAKVSQNRTLDYERRTITHKLSVDVPAVPDEIKIDIPQATGAYYRVIGDLLMDTQVAELRITGLENSFHVPAFEVTWIPKASSFNIKTTEEIIQKEPELYDPALLMKVGDDRFLIRTWDIKEEEPYDHFLREYTKGAYPKKK
jgi:hypothetical protein